MREIEKNKISTDEADYANESDIVGDLALEQNDVTSTRVRPTNGKLAMWIFLSSDFLFFGGFISAYLLYRGRNLELVDSALKLTGNSAKVLSDVVDIPFTSATSFILLMSSLTMVLSLAAIKRGDIRRSRVWLSSTVLFGTIFLGGQIYEFTQFAREGFTLTTNQSGSTFFVLTGLHGAHVALGIFWLLSLLSLSFQGKLNKEQAERVEIAGLYWHFVDVIWIVIFTIIYLTPVN
ncbi:MAG: heme-copper oxidase subunit III [Acidimicrobiia bacterium]